MGRLRGTRHFYNFILIAVLLVLLTVSLVNVGESADALALEQEARCGFEEHSHTEECYLDEVLICSKRAHVHSRNCYMLLLEDNDVNWLLRVMSRMEDKSLEAVMDSALVQALTLNPNFTSVDTQISLSGDDISSLNQTIADNNIDPSVVLNENLTGNTNLIFAPSGSSSTYAVGGTPSNANGAINFYILLDGNVTCIGNYQLSTSNNNRYTYSITDTVSVYHQTGIISDLTESDITDSDYYIRYKTNENITQEFNTDATVSGNTLRFGRTSTANARHAILTTRTGSWGRYTYTPVAFHTVTLDYSNSGEDKSNEVQYVQDGLNSTLSPDFNTFLWYTEAEDGTEVEVTASDYLENIDDKTTLYARPKNRTVTFITYGGTPEPATQTVKHGEKAKKPGDPTRENYSFDGWFTDEACTQPFDFDTHITENITLYAKWTGVSRDVTYNYYDSAGNLIKSETITVPHGDLVGFEEGYIWSAPDGEHYQNGQTFTITGNTVFDGHIRTYTITVVDENGNTTTETVEHGKSFTLGTLPADGNWGWLEKNGTVHQSGETIHNITSDLTFTASTNVTAQFVGKDGTTSTTVPPNTLITLPDVADDHNVWMDEDGVIFNAGDTLTLTENKVFTERALLKLSYDVSFSGTLDSQEGNTLQPSAPTIAGMSATTLLVDLTEGQRTVLHNVTPRMLTADTNQVKYQFDTAGYFLGWETETGEILNPAESFSYEDLAVYDRNGDGVVELEGLWESGWNYAANFVISFSSVTTGGENRDMYTNSLYTSYVDVPDGFSLSQQNPYYGSDNQSQTAVNHEIIQKLEGLSNGTDIGIYSIPSDQYIFDELKKLKDDGNTALSQLSIDGEPIPVEDLNSEMFAIRWYVIKYYSGDGWHIDGTLVRKTGNINVSKTFEGRSSFVDAAQNGFTITARAGTMNGSDFVDDPNKTDIKLVTSRAALESDTTVLGYDSVTETEDTALGTKTVTYTWVVHDVKAGEIWNISENLIKVDNAVGMGEWVIIDSSNAQSSSGIGTETQITGVTFPQDISSTEWLRADFTNVYHTENFLLIRKIDGLTRAKLAGAQFSLWQEVDGVEKPMTFDLEETTGANGVVQRKYKYNAAGTGAYLILESDGTEIDIDVEEFSYENGDVIIREVKAPEGYILADNEIRIGITGHEADNTPIIGIKNDADGYAMFNQGLVIIENFADTLDVTAKKFWQNCAADEWTDTVQVQLLANGSANEAASVLPADTYTVATLQKQTDANGNWTYSTYTWEDLPVYIDGEEVVWSIREIMIGDEGIKSDGTFPNWNSYPSVAPEIVTDASGNITANVWVTNRPKAGTELRLVKLDYEKTTRLSGAVFQMADEDGNVLATLTTDETGALVFPRLKYDTLYTITELEAPDGYWQCQEPFYVTIADTGAVTVTGCDCAQAGNSSFSLVVTNRKMIPLPETGGTGTTLYTLGGLLLILVASVKLLHNIFPKPAVCTETGTDTRTSTPDKPGRKMLRRDHTSEHDKPIPRGRTGPPKEARNRANRLNGLTPRPPGWWPPTVKLRQDYIPAPPSPIPRNRAGPAKRRNTNALSLTRLAPRPPGWWPPTVKLRWNHTLSPPSPVSRGSPKSHRKEAHDSS